MLALVTCLAIVSGCTGSEENGLAKDKYVAVQENLKTTCKITEGNYTLPPHITPPNAFVYDGSPSGNFPGGGWANFYPPADGYYPAVNDSFKVLYGTIYYRDRGPADTVTGLRIRGIYSFPYRFQSGFLLQNIDSNGTVYGSYNNTSIVLRIGEQWMSPASFEIKSGSGTDIGGRHYAYTASFNTTWTITNLGIINKANLTVFNNSVTADGFYRDYGGDPAGQ